MRTLWIVPEIKGGIRSYAETLLPEFAGEVRSIWHLPSEKELAAAQEEIIHLQHEYGLFGSKLPFRYRFPKWIRSARATSGNRKWIATAHTVLDSNWCYPQAVSGLRGFATAFLNFFVVPFARTSWGRGTWGSFDGVIVHSALQVEAIRAAGVKHVAVIPHYVPQLEKFSEPSSAKPMVLLFGYFSLEKGQDLVIRAWKELGPNPPKLVLAGGVRRPEDQAYLEECRLLIRKLGLKDSVEITGFVPPEQTAEYFRAATLVLAPFRATSGSGSLAVALGYGSATLASDLPLNQEIEARVSGCLATFRAGDPKSLAESVQGLLGNAGARAELRSRAVEYAARYSPDKIARLHMDFYRSVAKS